MIVPTRYIQICYRFINAFFRVKPGIPGLIIVKMAIRLVMLVKIAEYPDCKYFNGSSLS